jgi:hypothetical protein
MQLYLSIDASSGIRSTSYNMSIPYSTSQVCKMILAGHTLWSHLPPPLSYHLQDDWPYRDTRLLCKSLQDKVGRRALAVSNKMLALEAATLLANIMHKNPFQMIIVRCGSCRDLTRQHFCFTRHTIHSRGTRQDLHTFRALKQYARSRPLATDR